MDVRIGFAEFDAMAVPLSVRVGWCEFDALATPDEVAAPPAPPVTYGGLSGPGFRRGGAHGPYYQRQSRRPSYTLDVPPDTEADDEEVVLLLLLNIAARELL
jgi:hypothetical protein